MPFIQIIEYRTSHIDEIRSLSEQWVEETKGKRTATRSVLGRDPSQPGNYVLVVEFPSREDAMRNSALPATAKLAEAIGKLCDAPPTFRDIDDTEELQM